MAAPGYGPDYTRWDPIVGKLGWDVFPFYDPVILSTFCAVVAGGMGLFAILTYYRLWGYLWNEWLTSIDHKKSVSCI